MFTFTIRTQRKRCELLRLPRSPPCRGSPFSHLPLSIDLFPRDPYSTFVPLVVFCIAGNRHGVRLRRGRASLAPIYDICGYTATGERRLTHRTGRKEARPHRLACRKSIFRLETRRNRSRALARPLAVILEGRVGDHLLHVVLAVEGSQEEEEVREQLVRRAHLGVLREQVDRVAREQDA